MYLKVKTSIMLQYILDSERSEECIDFTMMCVFLDSERSEKCIDFTMMCVFFFFLCLCTRESVEIMLEFQTLGVVSDS
ncbi:Uncharacterized protein FWK35_00032042 [Aphis craccivora]|uniref:Uncharacterized protein n=1 Tax=Aphis craccivora TaxID=307492 RepID=A0A6G0YB65_APHCR|nr:Uncharacterized protein FWK35_00032042 [Aphis craccivora]